MPTVKCGFDDQTGQSGRDTLTLYGPTLWVQIGFDLAFRPIAGAKPELPPDHHPALVDTGAMESCIDSELALVLNLPIVDRQNLAGVHGANTVNVHLAQLYVPTLNFTVYGRFAGGHLRAGGQPHFALIGRTFLEDFTMRYEGKTGMVTLSSE